MKIIIDLLRSFFDYGLFFYAVLTFLSYLILAVFSGFAMMFYIRKNKYIDYKAILTSPYAPSVSILAPAYNEGATIINNVRSLLSMHYADFEVIIINDGSKDNTLEEIIEDYHLVKVDFAINYRIPCNEIRGVYKSTNKAFSKLIVVDKINGGKADALNAGINISSNKLFMAIDVDCIVEQDGILKMVKPFMEENAKVKVIASGGVVRIANSCIVENGKIVKVYYPDEFLARFQVLEYFRAFILGRMAWSKLNGLLLISGAFGMFDRELAVKAGGYYKETVGEDMELVVRMRRYMHEHKLGDYKVTFIPDPLCWTEVPDSIKVLSRQRNRWTRGTIDTLSIHRKLFLNPKYGLLGFVSFPYWLTFEWLAPFVEFFGLIYFFVLLFLGQVNVEFFLILLLFVISFAMMFSVWSIFFEEYTYHQYNRKGDFRKLLLYAFLEPFVYHPMIVWFALRGNWDYFIKKQRHGWGEMTRKGFKKAS
ncbi:MAG: glycosyltransferase [Bacteroidota bacterium]